MHKYFLPAGLPNNLVESFSLQTNVVYCTYSGHNTKLNAFLLGEKITVLRNSLDSTSDIVVESNAIVLGSPEYIIQKLQRVQNCAAL